MLVIRNKKSIPVIATAIFLILNRNNSEIFYSFLLFGIILIFVILSQAIFMPAKLFDHSGLCKDIDEGL